MISLNSVSPARLFSPSTEKLAPHRVTLLFGLIVLGALAIYVYRRFQFSLHDLGRQAFEKGEYRKASKCFAEELSNLDRMNAPLDSPLNIAPYDGRNAADLKFGEFERVIDSCNKVSKCEMDDQRRAQFDLQKGQAYLGLNNPEEAKQHFVKAIPHLPAQLLALAYYLLGITYEETGENFNATVFCDKALDQLSEKDLAFKAEIFALKALSFLDRKEYLDAIDTAKSALQLTGKASKETVVALYFCLASAKCAQKNYSEGFSYFKQALENIENDSFLRAYILSRRSYFYRAAAEDFPLDARANLRQSEEDFREAAVCKSDDRPTRSELLHCMMWHMFKDLKPGESPAARVAQKIEGGKAPSVAKPSA